MPVAELPCDTAAVLPVAVRIGDILANNARRSERKNHSLEIVLFMIGRDQKRLLVPVPQSSCLRKSALLPGPSGGKRISRIEPVIAKQKVESAMVLRRGRLSDDFDTSASRAGEVGGYGLRLILTSWMAEAETPILLCSIPYTTSVAPPVPTEPGSRNCDVAAGGWKSPFETKS